MNVNEKMKARVRKIWPLAKAYNILRQTTGYVAFLKDYAAFKSASIGNPERFPLLWGNRYPCLLDRTAKTGFDLHYVYHPAWAARILSETRPCEHVDISSLIDFSAIISAFIPVKFYDYRPASLNLSNLSSGHADLLALPFDDETLDSVSCMHVVEHIGLGRYGDPLDPNGDLKAIAELIRVLAPGGSLLFAVPIGTPKLMFNAHRVYSYQQALGYFPGLTLREFSLITDTPEGGGLIRNASQQQADAQTYGCGCFWFQKPIAREL